jgi:hypothetical protein
MRSAFVFLGYATRAGLRECTINAELGLEGQMFKIFVAATLLGALSTTVVLPDSSESGARPESLTEASIVTLESGKADRLQTPVEATARNFVLPRRNGNRVGFCLLDELGCGKEAADAYCERVGFVEAINFQRDRAISHFPRRVFRQIKCGNLAVSLLVGVAPWRA